MVLRHKTHTSKYVKIQLYLVIKPKLFRILSGKGISKIMMKIRRVIFMKRASILLSLMFILLLASCTNVSTITSQTTFHEKWTATQEHYWERELIYNFVNGEHYQWYSQYKLDYWFIMKELDTPFSRYHATVYQCTWTIDLKGDTSAPTRLGQIELFLIIKDGIVNHIEPREGNLEQVYEFDFDQDGQNELIYYFDAGTDNAYIFYAFEELADEPIYIAQYAFSHPIKIENNELVILTKDNKIISGVFKYRFVDGKKELYIDAGECSEEIKALK
jgi:hypothetical protein